MCFGFVYTDHKSMPKLTSEVKSILCCASLLGSVTCTAVVKCIYNVIAISIFTCSIHDHLYNQFMNKASVHLGI